MTNSIFRDAEVRIEDGPLGRFLAPVTDNWWLLLVTGIAWLLVSIVIFRFDYTTVAAVSVLFGIVALGAVANEVFLATVSSNGWRVAYLVMAGLSLVVILVSAAAGTVFEQSSDVLGLWTLLVLPAVVPRARDRIGTRRQGSGPALAPAERGGDT